MAVLEVELSCQRRRTKILTAVSRPTDLQSEGRSPPPHPLERVKAWKSYQKENDFMVHLCKLHTWFASCSLAATIQQE